MAFHSLLACAGRGSSRRSRRMSTPVHAANVHVDISIPNFGVQEMVFFPEVTKEVIPGAPEYKDGYMMVRETPGLGNRCERGIGQEISLSARPSRPRAVSRSIMVAVFVFGAPGMTSFVTSGRNHSLHREVG